MGNAISSLPLSHMNEVEHSPHFTKYGILQPEFQCVYQSPSDSSQVWIGLKDGVAKIGSDGIPRFVPEPELNGISVHAIKEDAIGHLWITTDGHGLLRYGKGKIHRFTAEESGLESNRCGAIHIDSEDVVWIGTERGLSRIEGSTVHSVGASEGLPHDHVGGILEDDQGRLWIASPVGIYRLDKKEISGFLAGRTTDLRHVIYDESDKLPTNSINGGFANSSLKTGDGNLWFGTPEGIVVIDPSIHSDVIDPPSVLIEAVSANQRTVYDQIANTLEHVSLAPGSADLLEFEFTATSLTSPQKIQIEYMLEGFDQTWRNGMPTRSATYTGLDPGNYRFRVRAANHHGYWNPQIASLSIHLRPFFIQTGLFKALVAASLVGIAGSVLLWRLARQRDRLKQEESLALQAERNRIARDLHDEIGSKITLALKSLDDAREDSSTISDAEESLQSAMPLIKELMYPIDEDGNVAEALEDSLMNLIYDYLSKAGVKVRFDWPEQPLPHRFNQSTRKQLLGVVQEALQNIVKHSKADTVKAAIAEHEADIVLAISDNGIGFDCDAKQRTGQGLGNMKTRMDSIEGRFELNSTPKKRNSN